MPVQKYVEDRNSKGMNGDTRYSEPPEIDYQEKEGRPTKYNPYQEKAS